MYIALRSTQPAYQYSVNVQLISGQPSSSTHSLYVVTISQLLTYKSLILLWFACLWNKLPIS